MQHGSFDDRYLVNFLELVDCSYSHCVAVIMYNEMQLAACGYNLLMARRHIPFSSVLPSITPS
jgi:hypothetical protein